MPDGSPGSSSSFSVSTSIPKLGTVNDLQESLGMDLSGILQAGLIHPVTGQIVNGNLRRDDAAMRRRRGRRKNVEGIDLIFLKERNLQTGLLVSNIPSTPTFAPLKSVFSLENKCLVSFGNVVACLFCIFLFRGPGRAITFEKEYKKYIGKQRRVHPI